SISLISIGSGAKEFYYRHIANASTLAATGLLWIEYFSYQLPYCFGHVHRTRSGSLVQNQLSHLEKLTSWKPLKSAKATLSSLFPIGMNSSIIWERKKVNHWI